MLSASGFHAEFKRKETKNDTKKPRTLRTHVLSTREPNNTKRFSSFHIHVSLATSLDVLPVSRMNNAIPKYSEKITSSSKF